MWSWWLVWIALGIGVVAATAGLVVAARAGLGAWRAFRGAAGAASDAIGDLTAKLEKLAASAPHGPQLEGSSSQLKASLARFAVDIQNILSSIQWKGPVAGAFRVAGAGFEPATSGL